MKILATLLASALLATSLHAEAVKDREGAVRGDREKMSNDARWIYGDIDHGFAEAKKSGKPVLVALRCVPCKSCMGIDQSILTSKELQPVLDQFVCVRVINANALDLSLFQFDYDLSFSTLIFNADRTLYGRFGSWQHQKDAMDDSTATYKAALEAALAIHKNFPANKDSLASKQGGPAPFKVPVEIPTLAEKYKRDLDWSGKVVQSCVHCHQVGDAFRAWYRNQNKPIPPELLYPMPSPETIGISLDATSGLKISDVAAGSAAAKAGLAKGDDIASVNGAPPISVADFAWALHRSPESGALKVSVRRDGAAKDVSVPLDEGWREKSDISSRVGFWQLRGMAGGGLMLTDLTDAERDARKLDKTSLAMLVKRVGEYGIHAAAKKAGFLKDDVLISIDGMDKRQTEAELLGQLLLKHPQKGDVKATVLRGETKVELTLPQQ
jgi:serine protease Do